MSNRLYTRLQKRSNSMAPATGGYFTAFSMCCRKDDTQDRQSHQYPDMRPPGCGSSQETLEMQ